MTARCARLGWRLDMRPEVRVPTAPDRMSRDTAHVSEYPHRFTVTLSLYGVVVNSVRYREDGHRDDGMIGLRLGIPLV